MARLILSLDGQVLAEYNMNKERYTVGRLPDNDVRIDSPAISGHHSLIINILNDSFLEDLNSTNGTYVNGKLIKKHALQHSDVITVGHHQLRFVEVQTNDSAQEEFEKTMVITPGSAMANQAAKRASAAVAATPPLAAKPAPAPPPVTSAPVVPVPPVAKSKDKDKDKEKDSHTATVAGADAPVALQKAKLQVLSGAFAGRELDLNKALTTLGRPGVQVAAISRRAEGFFIIHVDSGKAEDYPLVNGSPIGQQARKLANNDVIQLAGVKMGFFEG